MKIRPEQPADIEAIRDVNHAAFVTESEANLVDLLRDSGTELISLVAETDGQIVGHILFSPVTLSGHEQVRIAGLAPMAVIPDYQRQGIGSALINAGLEACARAGYEAVVVLGHPHYYPRFGFEISQPFGIDCEYEVSPEVFMIQAITPGILDHLSGTIYYHPLFNEV